MKTLTIAALALIAICSPVASFPPCPTEDSNSCYWDADTRSNGKGRSFIALADYSVIYLP